MVSTKLEFFQILKDMRFTSMSRICSFKVEGIVLSNFMKKSQAFHSSIGLESKIYSIYSKERDMLLTKKTSSTHTAKNDFNSY